MTSDSQLEVFELDSLPTENSRFDFIKNLVKENGDIYYDLDYLKVNDLHENGETSIATLIQNDSLIFYPFVKREIDPKYYPNSSNSYYDIITPYEYGGPFIINLSEENNRVSDSVEFFQSSFHQYCVSNNIIAESVRFNPLVSNNLNFKDFYETDLIKENIIIDLKKTEDELLDSYHKNKRRDVRKAMRNNIIVSKANSKSEFEAFVEIYIESMKFKQAKSFYYFSQDYFNGLFELINENKATLFIGRLDNSTPVAASIFLHSNSHVHYHLSGINMAYRNLDSQSLIIHEACLYFKNLGYDTIHLGGASKSQEGLYRFKKLFSELTVEYYFGRKIHNKKMYDLISQNFNNSKGVDSKNIDSIFFPIYRQA